MCETTSEERWISICLSVFFFFCLLSISGTCSKKKSRFLRMALHSCCSILFCLICALSLRPGFSQNENAQENQSGLTTPAPDENTERPVTAGESGISRDGTV